MEAIHTAGSQTTRHPARILPRSTSCRTFEPWLPVVSTSMKIQQEAGAGTIKVDLCGPDCQILQRATVHKLQLIQLPARAGGLRVLYKQKVIPLAQMNGQVSCSQGQTGSLVLLLLQMDFQVITVWPV